MDLAIVIQCVHEILGRAQGCTTNQIHPSHRGDTGAVVLDKTQENNQAWHSLYLEWMCRSLVHTCTGQFSLLFSLTCTGSHKVLLFLPTLDSFLLLLESWYKWWHWWKGSYWWFHWNRDRVTLLTDNFFRPWHGNIVIFTSIIRIPHTRKWIPSYSNSAYTVMQKTYRCRWYVHNIKFITTWFEVIIGIELSNCPLFPVFNLDTSSTTVSQC